MFTNQLKLLVRADVGPNVGTGHLMRTLALGQAWKRMGGEVTFVCGPIPRGLAKRVEAESFNVYEIQNDQGDDADAQDTTEVAAVVQPDWIVLDGYQFDDAYQRAIRKSGARLMVIDDFQHASHEHADLVVNQNCYANADQYPESKRGQVLIGERYVMLRDEFASPRDAWSTPRPTAQEARRILVTFGGSDPDNWTLKTLQALSDLKRKRLVVECVIGACYEHVAELEMFKKTAALNLRIHRDVDRMSALMTRVDLAITAGGSTCYELARCGIPSLVTSIAENQKRVARAMHQTGAMISLDFDPAGTGEQRKESGSKETRLVQTIGPLINDPERRREMSQRAMQLVDGQGALRTALKMAAFMYPFRAATMDDLDLMWHWRNDPEVRSVSFNQSLIPLETHQTWLCERLGCSNSTIWVAEDSQGAAVGQVRFEFDEQGQSALISIIVEQTRRGRGLGTILISAASQELLETRSTNRIIALIKPSNVASEKAFRAAGFQPIEPTIVDGKMALQFVLERQTQTVSAGSTLQKSA